MSDYESSERQLRDPKGMAVSIIKKIGIPWWYMDYDDLISEAYLGYLSAIRSYRTDKDSGFTHWAYIKMRWHIINYLIRKSPKDHDDIDDVRINKKFISPDFDESLLDNIDLRKAMLEITPRNREILKLHYWDGLSFREISHRYGLSKSAMIAVHRKSLNILRKYFHERKY